MIIKEKLMLDLLESAKEKDATISIATKSGNREEQLRFKNIVNGLVTFTSCPGNSESEHVYVHISQIELIYSDKPI